MGAVQPGGEIVECDTLSMTVGLLTTEKREWTSCFFAGPALFVAIDIKRRCVAWKVTFWRPDQVSIHRWLD